MTAAWSRPRPYPPDATKDLRPHKLKLLGLWRGSHYMELRDGTILRICPVGPRQGKAVFPLLQSHDGAAAQAPLAGSGHRPIARPLPGGALSEIGRGSCRGRGGPFCLMTG